jgi:hypothetical protein
MARILNHVEGVDGTFHKGSLRHSFSPQPLIEL